MDYDMRALPPDQRYKLLVSSVTPRPIAWVTSLSRDGLRNAAPFSFFNVMGADPPILVLGIMRRPDGSLKDTARNILDTKEFVVNLVREEDAAAMNATCIDAPADFDEIDYAGITVAPSKSVASPRIASAPVSFECRLFQAIDPGPGQTIILGEILITHVLDQLVQDQDRLLLDTLGMHLIARMHGRGQYARSTDLFEMQRPRYETASR